ncbi:hypothetical protein H8E77_42640 [bacterium]|nr:hypothetical protein [bacterium]
MNVKNLICDIIRASPPNAPLEQLVLALENQSDVVFDTLNQLEFQKQSDFLEKIFGELWPDSYQIAAHLRANWSKIEDGNIRISLNELASEKTDDKCNILIELLQCLENQINQLDEEERSIADVIRQPLKLQREIAETETRLNELRIQRDEQYPDLFKLRDIENQIEIIEKDLNKLQDEGFDEYLSELQERRDILQNYLDANRAVTGAVPGTKNVAQILDEAEQLLQQADQRIKLALEANAAAKKLSPLHF